MVRKKKSAARFAFDLHSICGIHIGNPADYSYVVGLVLNIPRQHSRAALASAIGTSVAMGGRVPESLFDGVCETPEEARELAFRINVERDRARFAARAKSGLPGVLGGR